MLPLLPDDHIPPLLRSELQRHWQRFNERAGSDVVTQLRELFSNQPPLSEQLARVFVASDFVFQHACNNPKSFVDWLQNGAYLKPLSQAQMAAELEQCVQGVDSDTEFDRQLRLFRRQMMWRIVWRDLCRTAPLQETTADMTALAEIVLQAAIAFHQYKLQQRFGVPVGRDSGQPQSLIVLGMGKLGGYELNVSSDIDLIFAYPESGDTDNSAVDGARKSISNQEFFIKLGQKIIASLDAVTADGFVFRVDMRLRPYGQSGPLVANFDALEQYYQTQGREWERYAMIKARVVAGSEQSGQQLMAMLRPFTYRKYLDFSAIESMRGMKAMINRQVQRKGMSSDVKLGAGGIREVEFIVQVFQLIRGGRDSRLHERQVLKLLPLLEQEELLPQGAANTLVNAYVFLRNTEHAIQAYQDRQTQSLPVDEPDLLRLAWVMGFDEAGAFLQQLQRHRDAVNGYFQQVIAESSESDVKDTNAQRFADLWPKGDASYEYDGDGVDYWSQLLQRAGMDEPQEIAEALHDLARSRAVLHMQPEGRARLDSLMPRLLQQLHQQQQGAATLKRVLALVESVSRRTAYLLLLLENPNALQQLVRLCSASSWIADQLLKHPSLLDELLDPRTLYHPPNKEELRDELRQQMLRVAWDDIEGQMEGLRYFRMAHGLRVAAAEVSGVLPIMRVSDYLTWLAEVILEHVLELGWQQMQARHGALGVREGEAHSQTEVQPQFIIVGYGKLGGMELAHGSDLDLVFIHNATATAYSDGERPLDNQTYLTRLGQKIIHILNTTTASGQLYEVDMRLRPSGNSGLLVSSLMAFEKYQTNEAWTWEHQALTRARVICGGEQLEQEFKQLRQRILAQPRDEQSLKTEVGQMREKMKAHLGTQGTEEDKARQFHLKQDTGGIVDIEFLVQFLVLAWAHKHPHLTRWSDNIRILEDLQAEAIMSADEVAQLTEAYKAYRAKGHLLGLQRQKGVVSGDEFLVERANVQTIWAKYLG